jgi:hypothetical protein
MFPVDPPVTVGFILDVIEALQPLIPLGVGVKCLKIVIGGRPSAARLVVAGSAPRPRLTRSRLLGTAGRPFLTTIASPFEFPGLTLPEFACATIGLLSLTAQRSRAIVVAAAAAATPSASPPPAPALAVTSALSVTSALASRFTPVLAADLAPFLFWQSLVGSIAGGPPRREIVVFPRRCPAGIPGAAAALVGGIPNRWPFRSGLSRFGCPTGRRRPRRGCLAGGGSDAQ